MKVLDIVMRNLLTLFGDHSSQPPLAYACKYSEEKYNYVYTYAIILHLWLKQRQYNKLHNDISFQTIWSTAERKKEQKKKEQKKKEQKWTWILSNTEALQV